MSTPKKSIAQQANGEAPKSDDATDAVNPYLPSSAQPQNVGQTKPNIFTPQRRHDIENYRGASATSTEMGNTHSDNASADPAHDALALRLAEQHADEIAANSELMAMIVQDYTESMRARQKCPLLKNAEGDKK